MFSLASDTVTLLKITKVTSDTSTTYWFMILLLESILHSYIMTYTNTIIITKREPLMSIPLISI